MGCTILLFVPKETQLSYLWLFLGEFAAASPPDWVAGRAAAARERLGEGRAAAVSGAEAGGGGAEGMPPPSKCVFLHYADGTGFF